MYYMEILQTVRNYVARRMYSFSEEIDELEIDHSREYFYVEFIDKHDDRLQIMVKGIQPHVTTGQLSIRMVSDAGDVDVTMQYDENLSAGYLEDVIAAISLVLRRVNYTLKRE